MKICLVIFDSLRLGKYISVFCGHGNHNTGCDRKRLNFPRPVCKTDALDGIFHSGNTGSAYQHHFSEIHCLDQYLL